MAPTASSCRVGLVEIDHETACAALYSGRSAPFSKDEVHGAHEKVDDPMVSTVLHAPVASCQPSPECMVRGQGLHLYIAWQRP